MTLSIRSALLRPSFSPLIPPIKAPPIDPMTNMLAGKWKWLIFYTNRIYFDNKNPWYGFYFGYNLLSLPNHDPSSVVIVRPVLESFWSWERTIDDIV